MTATPGDLEKELLGNLSQNSQRPDRAIIKKASAFAKKAHHGQERSSGEPYVIHPLQTALILNSWNQDEASLIAGLLHDTIEDAGTSLEEIEQAFGKEVRYLVDAVTKVSRVDLKKDRSKEKSLKKMFLAMSTDLRVIVVKMADRLHNIQTVAFLPEKRRRRFCEETRQIYAPLAYKLGMNKIKGDLLDYCFAAEEPKKYAWVKNHSCEEAERRTETLTTLAAQIVKALSAANVPFVDYDILKKHWYSLHKKLHRKEIDKDLRNIYDLVTLRLVVGSEKDCYTALGVVHSTFKPTPNIGISDFIAQPRPNGYRALHTRVAGPNGLVFEIQIRSQEMHQQSDFGIITDLSKPKTQQESAPALESRLFWTGRLIEWQESFPEKPPQEKFIKSLGKEMLRPSIYVLSGRGEVVELPQGSTVRSYLKTAGVSPRVSVRVDGKKAKLQKVLKGGELITLGNSN